jgi:hypothetical protein
MMSKVGLPSGGYRAVAHVEGDGGGRKHKGEKAKDRYGKEDIHASEEE